MGQQEYQLGMIGLGTMGCNLVLNTAEHGFAIAGYDKDTPKVDFLNRQAQGRKILGTRNLKDFFDALQVPHAIMILVPAGPPVDAVIRELLGYVRAGDIIVDGGNSHFTDTKLRQMSLEENGIHLLGVGISGGAEGARHGPSLMPGGHRDAYEKVQPVFKAIAAKVNGEPCVAYLGPGPAGHYVKMVHNGIEYGLMLLIAESYGLMKRVLGLTNDELHQVYRDWNEGDLNGFLMEITANIFLKVDERTGERLIDVIRPVAKQEGTGMWTSQDAMELHVPVPTIDMAVAMRNLSGFESGRLAASKILAGPATSFDGERRVFLGQLHRALHAGMLLTYAQGMSLLRVASHEHGYGLNLETVARIWRGGCIIRSGILEKLLEAYQANADLANPIIAPSIAKELSGLQDDLRRVVGTAAELGISASAFMASLAYYDNCRAARMSSNLVQAQRDYFGAHTYERIDAKGIFHTRWSPEPD